MFSSSYNTNVVLPLCLYISPSLSLYVSLSLSVSLPFSQSLFLCLSLSHSLSLSLSLSLPLYLKEFFSSDSHKPNNFFEIPFNNHFVSLRIVSSYSGRSIQPGHPPKWRISGDMDRRNREK